MPALGQKSLGPVLNGLDIAGEVSTAVTRAERFVLPGFSRTPANLAITLADSPYKQFLNSRASYLKNTSNAFYLLMALRAQAISWQNPPSPQIMSRLHTFVKDPYLKQSIDKKLANNNSAGAMQDLSEFYGLPLTLQPGSLFNPMENVNFAEDVFVTTTLNFLNRNPHKVPWQLRKMLKVPQIGAKYKGIVNTILCEPTPFSPQTAQNFSTILRTVHSEYSQLLRQAYQSPEVQITISFYNQALNELEDFVAAHNRAPRWDGPIQERKLYNQLMVITRDNPYNQFTEALDPLQKIQRILIQYPANTLSWEETLEKVELFIQKNGFFPRSYEATGGNTTEEELQLLDQVKYHTFHHPQLRNNLNALKAKYHLPLH